LLGPVNGGAGLSRTGVPHAPRVDATAAQAAIRSIKLPTSSVSTLSGAENGKLGNNTSRKMRFRLGIRQAMTGQHDNGGAKRTAYHQGVMKSGSDLAGGCSSNWSHRRSRYAGRSRSPPGRWHHAHGFGGLGIAPRPAVIRRYFRTHLTRLPSAAHAQGRCGSAKCASG